jgi:hypothetical protein
MSALPRFRSPAFLSLLFLVMFAALIFRVVWPTDQVIQSSDFNYGLMGMYKADMPESFFNGFWRGFPLLGRAGHAPPTWTNLSLALLPLDVYMDWIYAINLLIASAFLIGFLRLRGLGYLASLGGALAAFWVGSNLTLIYPGHLEKYGVLVFAAASLFCLEKTLQSKSWRWSLLSGGALGWMLMHQADLALFFGFMLGPWFLFGLLTRGPAGPLKKAGLCLPLLIMGLLFGWEAYQFSMGHHVNNVVILEDEHPEAKWEFATQWSWPPEESLDFIAPGYWGWMSQHAQAPYHGRMGQSPEWAESNQGFPNFKLESQYLGILPFFLCLLAWFAPKARRKDTSFWTLALLFSFLLACGKYTPLYAAFFKLPLVNAIRNPNKFLQVFQVCVGILSAYGLQNLLENTLTLPTRKRAALGLILASVLAGIGSLLVQPDAPSQLANFAQTIWQGQAPGILRNRQMALLLLSLISGTGAGLVFASVSPRFRNSAVAGLILLMALDGLNLSREYLKPANTRFLKENKLADFLKTNLGPDRVAVLENQGLYNFYLTHLLPYHHIAFADIATAPRLQADYQQYFDRVGEDRLRIWQEFGVKYVLAPRQFAQQVLRNPGMSEIFKEVYSYDIAEHPRGGLYIAPGKVGKSGSQVVLEFLLPSARFTLIDPDQPEFPATVQAVNDSDKIIGVLQSQRGFLIQTQIESPHAFLRLADHYDPNLRVRLNGGPPMALQPFDHLFCGLPLTWGINEIELLPPKLSAGILAQWTGLLLCALTLISLRWHPKNNSTA